MKYIETIKSKPRPSNIIRSTLTFVFGLLALTVVLSIHTPAASAVTITGTTQFPRSSGNPTATYAKPPTSNYDGSLGIADLVNNYGAQEFYLWCANGNIHAQELPSPGCQFNQAGGASPNDVNPGNGEWAHRTEGQVSRTSDYEVIANINQVNTNSIQVKVIDGCKALNDSDGWEDHMRASPNSGGALIVALQVGSRPANSSCNGNDIVATLTRGDFSKCPDPRFGSQFCVAHVTVKDTAFNDGEKHFGMSVTGGVYIGPPDQNTFPNAFVNLKNISADYYYQPAGPCKSSAGVNVNNCPNYFSMNVPYNQAADGTNGVNKYDFYFTPDCTNSASLSLQWRDGMGNQGVTQDASEKWTLTDTTGSTPNLPYTAGYGQLGSGKSPKFTFIQGHVYQWEWDNVDRAHGISIQLPYSEFTATAAFSPANCAYTGRIIAINAQCNAIQLFGDYDVSPNTAVDWQIWHQNLGASQFITYDFGSRARDDNGGGGFPKINQNTSTLTSATIQSRLKGLLPGGVNLFLRIKSPVNGNWYWVKYNANPTYTLGNNINPANTPPAQYGTHFQQPCNGSGSSKTPVGNINGTNCVGAPSALGAVWGWTDDPDNTNIPLRIKVLVVINGSTQQYTYGADAQGLYTADVPYPFVGNHGFVIPADPNLLLTGNRVTFLVYPLGIDSFGFEDGKNYPSFGGIPGSPANANIMKACAPFTVDGNTKVNLNPTNENPTNYSTTSSASMSFTVSTPGSFNPTLQEPACIVSVTYNGAAWGGPTITSPPNCPLRNRQNTSINGPTGPPHAPVTAGDSYCSSLSVWYTNGIIQEDGTVYNGSASNPPNPIGTGCNSVVNEPYFKVYGNGVSGAGGTQIAGSCVGGQITSWSGDQNNAGNVGYGSGAELSALARVAITGFASAQNTFVSGGGLGGKSLSFANNPTPNGFSYQDTPNMSTSFGSSYCLDFQQAPSNPTSPPLGNGATVDPASTGSGKYVAGDKSVVSASGNIPVGKNTALYVNGDVRISNNIVYTDNWTWTPTGNNIPSFSLIAVGGNIYIDPGVSNLDGLYIAEKNGGRGGNIYDCSDAPDGQPFRPMPGTSAGGGDIFDGCQQQLTVHGSFVASNQVNLMRSFGSLRNSIAPNGPNETPSSGARSCSVGVATASKPVCAGEVFDFSPEMYLSNLNLTPTNNGALEYDTFTSLPPVL